MSSIMDALKKSDAKRAKSNQGQKIHMDLKNHRVKKTRMKFYIIIFFLLLTLAAVYFRQPAFIWNYFMTNQRTDSGQLVTEKIDQTEAVKSIQERKTNVKLDKPTPQQVQTAAANKKQSITIASTNAESIAQEEPITTQEKPAEPNTSNTTPEKDSAQNTINTNTSQANATMTQTTDQPVNQIDAQLSETPMKNKQAINQEAEEKPQESEPAKDYIQYFELPFQVRQDIPKLNLSVHIYDPVVENRMAIINGIPVHVGDTIEELLTIQDITQTGVVLRVQNRDFIVLK